MKNMAKLMIFYDLLEIYLKTMNTIRAAHRRAEKRLKLLDLSCWAAGGGGGGGGGGESMQMRPFL